MCFPKHAVVALLMGWTTLVLSQPIPAIAAANPADIGHVEHDHSGHNHAEQGVFACPMHPQETGAEGDRCPVCNMFLTVPVGADAEAGHAGHDHSGHDHSGHAHAGPVENGLQMSPVPVTSPFSGLALPVEGSADGQGATVRYLCPMHPHIVGEEGDTCPICGMDLEPVQVGAPSEEVVVGVSGGMQQALGLRTQTVERGTLWRYVKTLGTVQYNEDAISHVHTRVTGWIESINVSDEGQRVAAGQLLYELYSPELVNAQDDYLQAIAYLRQDKQRGQVLLRKARLRLELLGVDESVIQRLERNKETLHRVPFYAPQDGIVSALSIRDGMYIQPGSTLLELVDLSSVWVIADVFEKEQSWLEQGRPADVTASAQGLFSVEGQIDYIYPELDPVTRAMRVRVELENPDFALRPGTLVQVELFGGPKRGLLIIPTEALILTGAENRVVVQRDNNGFASVPVRLGMISQGKAEILDGLQESDKVVVSGQFLLDSEASIQGSLLRLGDDTDANNNAHSGHDH